MEEHVSLFAMDRDIGGGALGHRVWGCCDILVVFVLGERLRSVCLDVLWTISDAVYDDDALLTVSLPKFALGMTR